MFVLFITEAYKRHAYIFFQLVELSRLGDLTTCICNSHDGEVSRLILGPKGKVLKSNPPNRFHTHSFNMGVYKLTD
jgi:hypothetical protein